MMSRLQVETAGDFCDGTVCPVVSLQKFVSGANLTTSSCHNGDQSQLFAATYSDAAGATHENLMPLFWATAAYVRYGTSTCPQQTFVVILFFPVTGCVRVSASYAPEASDLLPLCRSGMA
jgi:predicted membrane protein